MIDPGRPFLLVCGVGVAVQFGVGVAGHVPGVRDPRGRRGVEAGRLLGPGGLRVIPEVDLVVVGPGVVAVPVEDRIQDHVDRLAAADLAVLPGDHRHPGPGIEVIGKFLDDRLQGQEVILLGLCPVGAVLVQGFERIEIQPLAVVDLGRRGLGPGRPGEALGPSRVVDIAHGHAPVGHRAGGVEQGGLAEGPLGLEVVERMELGHALIDEGLGLGAGDGDGEVDPAHARDQGGPAAGAFVERLAVDRVAGGGGGRVGFGGRGRWPGRLLRPARGGREGRDRQGQGGDPSGQQGHRWASGVGPRPGSGGDLGGRGAAGDLQSNRPGAHEATRNRGHRSSFGMLAAAPRGC